MRSGFVVATVVGLALAAGCVGSGTTRERRSNGRIAAATGVILLAAGAYVATRDECDPDEKGYGCIGHSFGVIAGTTTLLAVGGYLTIAGLYNMNYEAESPSSTTAATRVASGADPADDAIACARWREAVEREGDPAMREQLLAARPRHCAFAGPEQ